MATAENVLAVYSDRGKREKSLWLAAEEQTPESRMRSKDSCPVWREVDRKSTISDGNSPASYSTARTVLRGRWRNALSLPDRFQIMTCIPTQHV
jgi:hypothetical protein